MGVNTTLLQQVIMRTVLRYHTIVQHCNRVCMLNRR